MSKYKNLAMTALLLLVAAAPIAFSIYSEEEQVSPIVADTRLVGNTEAVVGELLRLKAVGEQVKWTIMPLCEDCQSFGENQNNLVVSFRNRGTYTIIAAIIDNSDLYIETLEVRVGPSTPGRPPVAPTRPSVTVDDYDQGIADKVSRWTESAGVPARISSELADVFDDVASDIEEGNLVTSSGIVRRTAQRAETLDLGDYSTVLTKIQGLLTDLADSGDLQTPMDHAGVWKSIAKGLRPALGVEASLIE